jgi:hypothetical protein
MKTLEFTQHRNDLHAEFKCTCPSAQFAGTSVAHIMKTRITLSGYNDAYFFDVVNAEPRVMSCDCGRKYSVQWKRDGVEVAEVPA